MMRSLSAKSLFAIAGSCVVVAMFVLPSIGGEEGTAADIAFIVQMVVALAAIAALVSAVFALRRAS